MAKSNSGSNGKSPKGKTPKSWGVARKVSAGDVAPQLRQGAIEEFVVTEATRAAQLSKTEAVEDIVKSTPPHDMPALARSLKAIMEGSSPDDAAVLRQAMMQGTEGAKGTDIHRDAELSADWREGGYPYKNLLSRKSYEMQKYHLQVELLKVQAWVKAKKQRVVILFEGRDAAAKGNDQAVYRTPELRGCRGWWRWRSRAKWNGGSGTSSVTWNTCRRRERS
ncbi:MAG: hypothetical protein U0903_06660 [Planctomycetales bacterium]